MADKEMVMTYDTLFDSLIREKSIELPDALPESWIEQVEFAERREVPARFGEPAVGPARLDPETAHTIETVKRVCFPFFGLEP